MAELTPRQKRVKDLLLRLKDVDDAEHGVSTWEGEFLDTMMRKLKAGQFSLSDPQERSAQRILAKYEDTDDQPGDDDDDEEHEPDAMDEPDF